MPSVLLPFKCNDAAYVAPASSVHEPLIPFITCDFIEIVQVDVHTVPKVHFFVQKLNFIETLLLELF